MTDNEHKAPESLISGFYSLKGKLEAKEQEIISKDGNESLVKEDIADLQKSELTLNEIIESSQNGEVIEGRTRKIALAEEALTESAQYIKEIKINNPDANYGAVVAMISAYEGIDAMVEYTHGEQKVIFEAHDVSKWDKFSPMVGDMVTFYANDTVNPQDIKRLENAIDHNVARILGKSVKHDDDRANYLSFDLEIKDKDGLHARPSASLIKAASKYDGNVYVIAPDGNEGSAKSIMQLMMLSSDNPMNYGTRLTFQVEPVEGENITELHKNLKLAIGTETDQAKLYKMLK